MRFIIFLCIGVCITFLNVEKLQAQKVKDLIMDNPGLQVGMYQGSTEFEDAGYNYYFRIYNKHAFDARRFGEFSISSGFISGLGYRSQLTPLEYRLGYHLSMFGVPEPNVFGQKSSFYSYAGLGLLYSRPLEIAAPDDPLTVEMGNRLPSSSFWDFNGGITPFIPVGIGMEIPLDPGAKLNITTGYNHSLAMLKFNSHDVPKGYWGISIGIDFKREKKREPVRFSSPPITTFISRPVPEVPVEIAPVQPVDNTSMLLDKLNRGVINFDVLSSTPDDKGKEWIAEVAGVLKLHPAISLQVFGHADSIGTEAVNQMISESRARAIWLALIDEGVDGAKIGHNWYSDDRPVQSNITSKGRFQNRRVEFKTGEGSMQLIKQPRPGEIYRASIFSDFEYGKPLLESRDIDFNLSMLGFDQYSAMLLQLVSYLMHSEPEMELVVLSQAGANSGTKLRKSLSKARAEKIRGELILKGIDAKRVQSATPGSDLYVQYQHHLKGTSQQNILIPVNRESGDGFGEDE